MKLYIKYMVSIRCKMILKQELENLGLDYRSIELGEVEITRTLEPYEIEKLKIALLKSGLELMDDKKAIWIEKVKNVVIEMIHYSDELPKQKNSVYISQKIHLNYNQISSLFSETTGITLEHYIIVHKIEKAKELILYDELNLSEIADKLGYKNVSHLSSQFKTITGNTPSFYKHLKYKRRTPLEDL